MTAQIRAAAIKDSSRTAPGAPEADHSPDAAPSESQARAIMDLATNWVCAAMSYASHTGTADAELAACHAFKVALMGCAAPNHTEDSLGMVAPFGYVDLSAKYSAAAFAFEPHGDKVAPVYLAPVSARDGEDARLFRLLRDSHYNGTIVFRSDDWAYATTLYASPSATESLAQAIDRAMGGE